MAPSQTPALRKVTEPSPKRTTTKAKAHPEKDEEPWEDISHLSGIEQLIEIGKQLTPQQISKIKVWPLK